MELEFPQALWLLGLIPAVLALTVLEYRQARRFLLGLTQQTADIDGLVRPKLLVQGLCLVACLTSLTLALADPHWGDEPVPQDKAGLDLVFLVDVSRSMDATDLAPSRLERSRDILQGVLPDLGANRLALYAWKGRALPLVPLTEDSLAVERALRELTTDLQAGSGSNLGNAVQTGLAELDASSDHNDALVVFSDGEGSDDLGPAISQARKRGVPLVVVATGTSAGATIPQAGGGALLSGGQAVVSHLDRARLESLADATGGTYLDAASPSVFSGLTEALKTYQQSREREGFFLHSVSHRSIFLSLAILALGAWVVVRSLRWGGRW